MLIDILPIWPGPVGVVDGFGGNKPRPGPSETWFLSCPTAGEAGGDFMARSASSWILCCCDWDCWEPGPEVGPELVGAPACWADDGGGGGGGPASDA